MKSRKKTKVSEEVNVTPENPYVAIGRYGDYVLVDDLVSDLLREYSIVTIYNSRGEDVWTYDRDTGLWKPNGREVIKTRTENLLDKYAKIKVCNEVFEKIKRLTAKPISEFDNVPANLLLVKNGILNVEEEGGELLPFNSKYYFKKNLDIVFDKSKDCPRIKKFIQETFYEDDIPVIQEWLGFHLYKKYFLKKAMILFGQKDTGKTVFLKLLVSFVGEKNKAGISLHNISRGHKFTLSFLPSIVFVNRLSPFSFA